MTLKRYDQIALDLEKKLADDPHFLLPTLNHLSEAQGVSYPTAWKAMQALIQKGLARSVPGKGFVPIRASAGAPSEDASLFSVDKLCREVRDGIANGIYKSGKPFPKAFYFMSAHHVTRLTVTRAFRRLASERCAHKHKNRWIVGAPPEPAQRSHQAQPPVVLFVLTDTVDALPNFFQNQFVSPFVNPLRMELAARQISLAVAAWYGDPRTGQQACLKERTASMPPSVNGADAIRARSLCR